MGTDGTDRSKGDQPPPGQPESGRNAATPAVEYARRLYDDVLGWYQNADAKAQVVLALDGAFLAFIAAAAFQKPDDLTKVTDRFSPWTWRLLGLMAATLAGSLISAIVCLWSRIYLSPSSLVESILNEEQPRTPNTYPPGVMWFFQLIAALKPPRFRDTLFIVDGSFEVDAMASQISKLSDNVRKKHVAVDVAFVLAILTLLLFAGAAATYVAAKPTG